MTRRCSEFRRKQGMIVPKIEHADVLDLTQARWILVIEKEVCVIAMSLHILRRSGNISLSRMFTILGYEEVSWFGRNGNVPDHSSRLC